MSERPKIAVFFRYGPADNVELAHATPWILEGLAERAEVHYFSHRGSGPIPACVTRYTQFHPLPFSVNRSSSLDKFVKTALWYLALPFIALRCRFMGVRVVYLDDFQPLGATLARLFSGAHVVIFVVDFLLDAYADKRPWLRPLVKTIHAVDTATWRKLPLIFTRTHHARGFLEQKGVPPERLRTVYDACDVSLYHPTDREKARATWGYGPHDVVLSHHGVLHPNKGLDRILEALPPLIREFPAFRFLCIGSGPELQRLQDLADRIGIADHVTFTGWLPTAKDVNIALNASDIGLVMRLGDPSDHFHLTGALVHSMAVGLPVLAPRLAGMQEVLKDGVAGYAFEPSDMNEFQARCRTLLADPDLRQRLGAAALETAQEEFDVHIAARKVSDALLELAHDA
jgi:glycosyltransferase involved in cell wall biosynthesis